MMLNHSEQSLMLSHALGYIQDPLNWRLCQLRPNSKAPMLAEWNSPSLAVASKEAATGIWQNSKYGIGLVHESSGTGAFDVDSMEWAEYVFSEFGINIQDLLEGYPRIKGRDGRDKIIFRLPESLPIVKLVWPKQSENSKPVTVFELRGKGGQDVLPPSIHPDTLSPYEWVVSPFHFKDGIPMAPDALITIWKHWSDFKPQFESACPWAEQKITYPTLTKRHVGRSDFGVIDKFNEAHDVVEILEFNGYQRKGKRWLSPTSSSRIPGVVVFDCEGKRRCFSHHASDPLNDGYAHDAFDLLVILGNNNDFSKALESAAQSLGIVLLPKQVDYMSDIDIDQLKANAKARKSTLKTAISTEFTPNLQLPVAKLNELSAWFSGLTNEPTPAISTAGAVAFGSVLAGRLYRSTEANWTSLLMAVSGPSGVGKNYIKVGIERALIHAGLNALVSGDFYTHQAAVYSELRAKPCHICISDEFGENFLEARKNNNSNKLTVFKSFKKAYSDADHIYKSESYSKMPIGKNIDTTPIVCPSLTLLGLTTPLQFYSEIKTSHIESGLINRFIVVNVDKTERTTSERGEYYPSEELVGWIKDVRQTLKIGLSAFDAIPTYTDVVFHPKAKDLFDKAKRDQESIASMLEVEHLDSMPMRWRESAMRVATMLAACANQESPIITEEMAHWAIHYVFGYGMKTIDILRDGIGENDYQTQANSVLSFIASRDGTQDQELSRKFRGIKKRERIEILMHLQEAELIYCQKESNVTGSRGRDANIWRAF